MAGGSSSGSAALVAAGEVDMAIAGDQGGSIRIPSSNCGVCGMKPTHGLVPYTGIMPIEQTLDCVGPVTAGALSGAEWLAATGTPAAAGTHPPSLAPADGRSRVAGDKHPPLRYATIPDVLRETVSRHGPRDAVVLPREGRTLSYYDLDREVDALAGGLLALSSTTPGSSPIASGSAKPIGCASRCRSTTASSW